MKKNRITPIAFALVALLLASLACNLPGSQPEPTEPPERIASPTSGDDGTEQIDETEETVPTDTPGPTETDLPTETPTPSITPSPTPTEIPCDRAEFVMDVTIPDGTDMDPGEAFTKTWRLENNGSCTWTTDYDLIFVDGEDMGPDVVALTGTVSPGETIDVSINLTAPSDPGNYKGYYKLRNAGGVNFGIGSGANIAFYVEIEILDPTQTPEPKADLYVSNFVLDPATPIKGQPVDVRVEVYNKGNKAAGAFQVAWYGGEHFPSPGCTWNIASLAHTGGRVLTCTYAGYNSWYGSIVTVAIVDTADTVDESNESNNEERMTISVTNP